MSTKKRSKDKTTSLKTLRNWEKEFECNFDHDMEDGYVVRLRCQLCKKYQSDIEMMKNFKLMWISPGCETVKRSTVESHLNSLTHKYAKEKESKKILGIEKYMEKVVDTSPLGRGLKKMCCGADDMKALRIKFNTAYYVAKQERPYADYPSLLELQNKNGVQKIGKSYLNDRAAAQFIHSIAETMKSNLSKDLANCRYYSVLNDGSTDSSTTEQELVYILYIDNGTPMVKYFSVESPKNANAEGIKDSINESFRRIGITDFTNRLVGLNVDGASVNMGKHEGLAAKFRELAPWLVTVHCFNHRVELAIKDAFKTSAFENIDEMLRILYYLYKKSSKRCRELERMSEAYEKAIPKPTNANGTRWIDHKMQAMKIVLENYGVFISHVESLSQTDSQASKRAELKGYLKKWKDASYPINISIYLDVLSPIRQLSLSFQQDLHDPVKAVRRIKDFTWSMTKLQMLIMNSLDSETSRLTYYKKCLNDIKKNEEINEVRYQEIKLKRFEAAIENVPAHYEESITRISDTMTSRFKDVQTTCVFKHISILDVTTWPRNDMLTFGDNIIVELKSEFHDLLEKNNCDMDNLLSEWDQLKCYMMPLISNWKSTYLQLWKEILTKQSISSEFKNIFHIIEIMLILPFTNAKVERMFSRMNRTKTDWRNRLNRDSIDALLRIGEEGPSVKDFNPDQGIERWYNAKVRRLTAQPNKYSKRQKSSSSSASVNLSSFVLSDLESSDDENTLFDE